MSEQKNPAAGGRYVVAKPGAEPKRTEAPGYHAEGARARDAGGARLNRQAEEAAAHAKPAAPAPTIPADKPAKS